MVPQALGSDTVHDFALVGAEGDSAVEQCDAGHLLDARLTGRDVIEGGAHSRASDDRAVVAVRGRRARASY